MGLDLGKEQSDITKDRLHAETQRIGVQYTEEEQNGVLQRKLPFQPGASIHRKKQ